MPKDVRLILIAHQHCVVDGPLRRSPDMVIGTRSAIDQTKHYIWIIMATNSILHATQFQLMTLIPLLIPHLLHNQTLEVEANQAPTQILELEETAAVVLVSRNTMPQKKNTSLASGITTALMTQRTSLATAWIDLGSLHLRTLTQSLPCMTGLCLQVISVRTQSSRVP